MFERFTERARQVVVLAQDEARMLKHNYIGTEHLLLGLLRVEEGLAAQVLRSLDVTRDEVRAQVVRIIGQGEEISGGQIPFTPRAKVVLELSLREALSLGHDYIGTEHLLLGLVRENEGVAARILLDFDADAQMVRSEVLRRLSVEEPAADEPQEADAPAGSFSAVTYSHLPPRSSSLRLRREVSFGGRPPWWEPLVLRVDLWMGMLLGALIFGVGLVVGLLIWG